MTAYINKLKNKTGNQQLPVTHERAVRDDNGTTLESKMQNLEGAMDKAYVAQSDNGMGRITLHKNMVSGVNTLTQSMMQATNTIYIIRYDFTLGEDITVPANCVLAFDGGSINNGTVNFNDCIVISDKENVFNNLTCTGKIKNTVYADWFDSLTTAFASTKRDIVLGVGKTYVQPTSALSNYDTLNIVGHNSTILTNGSSLLQMTSIDNLFIRDVIFDGNNETPNILYIDEVQNLIVENCTFKNAHTNGGNYNTYGLYLTSKLLKRCVIDSCLFRNMYSTSDINIAHALLFDNDTEHNSDFELIIRNCTFNYIVVETEASGTYVAGKGADGIFIMGNYDDVSYNVLIEDCQFVDISRCGVKAQSNNVTVNRCSFLNKTINYFYYGIRLFGKHCRVCNCDIQNKIESTSGRNILIYNELRESDYNIVNNEFSLTNDYYCPEDIVIEDNSLYFGFNNNGSCVGVGCVGGNLCKYSNIKIVNNSIYGIDGTGIKIQEGFGENITISNNTFYINYYADKSTGGIRVGYKDIQVTKGAVTITKTNYYKDIVISNSFFYSDRPVSSSTRNCNAIFVWCGDKKANCIIIGNTFNLVDVAATMYGHLNSMICNNNIFNVNYGVVMNDVHHIKIVNNLINNPLYSNRGIYDDGGSSTNVTNELNDIYLDNV